VLNDKLSTWLKEGESEQIAFRVFFGHETIETLTAFANLHGGVLLLGISEMREIKGVPNAKENIDRWLHEIHTRTTPQLFPYMEVIEIDGKSVVSISIAEYPVKPVACEGKYYKRFSRFNQELTLGEAIDFRRQLLDSHWDSSLRPDKTIADISLEKLYRQIERISRKKQCTPEEPLAFLRKYGLAEGDAITNACWLLFHPGEEPEATIELGRFSSPTVALDTLTLKSDLFSEAEEAVRFICKHICIENQTEKSAQWQYPLEAIRELVVNMIIHKDYTSDYNSIIKIFDGYVEFYNPGALPDDLSIKQLLWEEHISRPRNCQIAELFKEAGMFEGYGSGIRQIITAFVNRGLRPPEFIKLPERLIVRVFGETSAPQATVPVTENTMIESSVISESDLQEDTIDDSVIESDLQEEVIDSLSNRERQIIDYIQKDNRISLNEIAQKLMVSKRTILRDIKKMKKGKVINRIGNEKNGYWEIDSVSLP